MLNTYDQLMQQIADGDLAEELLNNESFHKVIRDMAQLYQNNWLNTQPTDEKIREILWQKQQTLIEVKNYLAKQVQSKKQAQASLENLNYSNFQQNQS